MHTDNDETAFTLGLDYARQFSPRWAVIAYAEIASSDLERDTVIAAGLVFYPMRRLALVVASGVEVVSEDIEVHGSLEKEEATEFLARFGARYGFPVGQASLGPVVFADWAGERWTFVYSIGMVVGF